MSGYYYTFASIRGIQAGREYYVAMCPLKLIPKIFLFDDEELSPELRAQRTLNAKRIPTISRYITQNRHDYVFSAITASISGNVVFDPIDGDNPNNELGNLRVDMNAQFLINDGQHRRAAIEQAIREDPTLGEETIAVVFYRDEGLAKSQQMFADLNQHAIRPARTLGLLYDHRDDGSRIAKMVALKCNAFKGLVELERRSLAERSRKLFTLSSLHSGTEELLASREFKSVDQAVEFCVAFWDAVAAEIPEWESVKRAKQGLTAGEVRREFVHTHGVMMQAFGRVGSALPNISISEPNFSLLRGLSTINWERSNHEWEGRVMLGGRISKASGSVALASAYIKSRLGIALTPEETKMEQALRGKKRS